MYSDIAKNGAAGDAQYAKRWFPMAVVAKQIGAYTGLVSAYNTAKGTFNDEAGKYNDVIKDMKDYAADTNAFKAAKKFDLPKRPSGPSRLHEYKGLRTAAWANVKTWTFVAGQDSQLTGVTADEVVIAGSHSGGWGSFTAGILGTGSADAAHSFGCFGWSKLGTATGEDADAEKRSYV